MVGDWFLEYTWLLEFPLVGEHTIIKCMRGAQSCAYLSCVGLSCASQNNSQTTPSNKAMIVPAYAWNQFLFFGAQGGLRICPIPSTKSAHENLQVICKLKTPQPQRFQKSKWRSTSGINCLVILILKWSPLTWRVRPKAFEWAQGRTQTWRCMLPHIQYYDIWQTFCNCGFSTADMLKLFP